MPDKTKNMVELPGSERRASPQAVEMGPADPQEQVTVTVYCCASGDSGSSDGVTGVHSDYPASDPNILGVGSTNIVASGSSIKPEVLWNGEEGAGGVSTLFPLPSWQTGIKPPAKPAIHVTGRGVPDVAGLADPEAGFDMIDVTGKQLETIGGTSASTPLWASLIAPIDEALGADVGFFNPLLYSKGGKTLNDITQGNNGRFIAAPGWDACTGGAVQMARSF